MATEYPSRLLLNGGADRLVLNGGADILELSGDTDYHLDDLAGAGATAGASDWTNSFVFEYGSASASAGVPSGAYGLEDEIDAAGATASASGFTSSYGQAYPGAGASAELAFMGAELGFPSAGATSSATDPVIEPGPIDFTVSLAAGANAGLLSVGNHWEIEYPAVAATAGSIDFEIEPGPIDFPPGGILAAASATASIGIPSRELSYPAPGATAGVSTPNLETEYPTAGATASGSDVEFEPGPIDFTIALAASANAGTLSAGNHWEIEHPGVGASAGIAGPSYELSLADSAGATAGIGEYELEIVPASAGATATANDAEILPGEVFFPLSGVLLAGGANAGVLSAGNHWEVEYPAVAASASGADPVFEPGPISFPFTGTLEGSEATAGVSDYSYLIEVECETAEATAGAITIEIEPGPVDMPLDGAGATAGTDAEGYDLDVYFPAVAATAGAPFYDLEVSLPDAAAATAGTTYHDDLIAVVPPSAPIVNGVRATDYASATLTWSSIRGANTYFVYRGEGYRDELTLIATVSDPTTTYVDSGLDTSKSYTYAVRSVDGQNSVLGLRSLAVYLPGENETLNP